MLRFQSAEDALPLCGKAEEPVEVETVEVGMITLSSRHPADPHHPQTAASILAHHNAGVSESGLKVRDLIGIHIIFRLGAMIGEISPVLVSLGPSGALLLQSRSIDDFSPPLPDAPDYPQHYAQEDCAHDAHVDHHEYESHHPLVSVASRFLQRKVSAVDWLHHWKGQCICHCH